MTNDSVLEVSPLIQRAIYIARTYPSSTTEAILIRNHVIEALYQLLKNEPGMSMVQFIAACVS